MMGRETISRRQPAFDNAEPAFNDRAPQTAALLNALDRGEAEWWSQVEMRSVPLVEADGTGVACVTFLWRDLQGCEQTSPIERVYADVNSVTDHHSFTPQSLERVTGTDIWFWQVELPMDWRGSYAFIPVRAEQTPPRAAGDLQSKQAQQREWWRSIASQATADPLNPLNAHTVGMSMPVSPLHLPEAPNYALWHAVDSRKMAHEASPDLIEIDWVSALQDKQRKVWVYVSGKDSKSAPADDYPLAVLLDGSNWIRQTPISEVLEAETIAGHLPPAVYVFVDAIDGRHRAEDMTCNACFWEAVRGELLPMVASVAPVTSDPARSVVAGQSYGGLAAVYAGVHMPERFGLVLSQSGSFWWPNFEALRSAQNPEQLHDAARTGWLTAQVETRSLPVNATSHAPLRVFMEVGSREDDMIDASNAMEAALKRAGNDVFYRQFVGGHDGLCWRNGLIDGLRWLFAPHFSSEDNSQRKKP
jgi:enterochelin esterase family protein